jgi:hypothetical protein
MSKVLEDGDIYFLYRPRVEDEHVESLAEVQRLLMVLRPWRGRGRIRLLVVGRKQLPEIDERARFWAFVDVVVERPEQLHDALQPRRYATKTRGQRHQPAARPAAEGAYAITRHDDHTHLAYQLELPRRPGPPQQELHIEQEASYVVTVKKPEAPSPPRVGLPADLQRRFGTRRFAPLDPPTFLDQPGAEIVLIGAAHDASAELDIDLDAEVERAARNTIFEDLHIGREDRPTEPLFAGQWR